MNDNYKYFHKYLVCPHTQTDLEYINKEKPNFFKSGSNIYPIQNDVPILLSKLNYKNTEDADYIKSIEDFWDSGWEKRSEEDDHSFLYDLDEDKFFIRLKQRFDKQELRGKDIGEYHSNEIKFNSLVDKTCVIIGPGCGEEAMELNLICKAKVIGVDISYKSANLTNKLLHKFGDKSGIGIQGDSRFLPIKSNSIDFVFSNGVIHHSPNIEKSIAEIHRVLKPNGRFSIALYHKHSVTWLKFLLKALLKGNWTKKSLEDYISIQTEVAWITSDKKNPHTRLFSKSQCLRLFDKFNNLHVRPGAFSTPGNFYLKFLGLFKNTKLMSKLGSMIYISGSKT